MAADRPILRTVDTRSAASGEESRGFRDAMRGCAAMERHMSGLGNSRSGSAERGFGLGLLLMLAVSIMPLPISTFSASAAGLGGWSKTDPARVLPMDQVPAEFREQVDEVIREHTFHRQGDPESFPCNAGLYMSLVNEPVITLALWKDLAESPVQVKRIGPNRYQGEDGSGSTATWDFVLRTPRVHVLLAYLSYISPRGNARIDARILLVLHSGYYREVNREPYVQHDVEAFVKVDSKGWKTLARTIRPVIERVLEDQVREAGQFVSLMSRLVVNYPAWATDVAMKQSRVDAPARERFREIVAQNRKPDASNGRPVVLSNPGEATADTRRR